MDPHLLTVNPFGSPIGYYNIPRFLIQQSGLKGGQARSGAVTLIQRFGSAANLNIHSRCLVLDGVYRSSARTGFDVGPRWASDALVFSFQERVLSALRRHFLAPKWLL